MKKTGADSDCERVGKSIALKSEQIREIAKLPSFVAAVYQNDWVEAVLCKSERFDHEKPFRYQPIDSNSMISEFLSGIFLSSETIERLDVLDDTKHILHKALEMKSIDDYEKCYIAYNLFGGKKVASILEDAENPTQGMKKAHSYIDERYSLNNDALSESISKYIWFTINSDERYAGVKSQVKHTKIRHKVYRWFSPQTVPLSRG